MADDKRTSQGPAETVKPLSPGDEAAPGTPGVGENVCPDCKGTGRLQDRECPTCGGTGVVEEGVGGA
ncbi:hypothetical protein [Salinarimonas ramus]|uniref:Chaperone protein DnaJ n=1 Tax=Salinarimonas ramus TaxID=690164 RepID=A0A917QG08_9HYPH|nr:hypothetical protein [Salinarimonas ramus]GGK49066.1 hypothetical protein GCM10011322_40080 [Salinarimonas ramus]